MMSGGNSNGQCLSIFPSSAVLIGCQIGDECWAEEKEGGGEERAREEGLGMGTSGQGRGGTHQARIGEAGGDDFHMN